LDSAPVFCYCLVLLIIGLDIGQGRRVLQTMGDIYASNLSYARCLFAAN
jgi:hypothetical protein